MRPKLKEEELKKSITITIDNKLFDNLNNLNVNNKSKLINWLLTDYLNKNGYDIKNKF